MKRNPRKYLKFISLLCFSFLISIISVVVFFCILKPVFNVVSVSQPIYNSLPNKISTYHVLSTFYGSATAYEANCPKCSGKLACNSTYNVSDGTIYYKDPTYGEVRIVASSSKYPCGTILLASFGEIKTMAIVLDRGVVGNKMDLLFSTEEDCNLFGRKQNVKYEILRFGY